MKGLLIGLLITLSSAFAFGQLQYKGVHVLDRIKCEHTGGEILKMPLETIMIETDSTITFITEGIQNEVGTIESIEEFQKGVYGYVVYRLNDKGEKEFFRFARARKEYIVIIADGDKQIVYFKEYPKS